MAQPVSPFRPCFLKIERAQQHYSELEHIAQQYMAHDPAEYEFTEHNPEGDGKRLVLSFKVTFNTQPQPESISVILGDIFHNLRSALDMMATTLAELNGQSPNNVYFPFAGSEDGLAEQITSKHFDRAGPAAEQLLREFRPFKGGNIELRAIHDLNIRDKHRQLIVQKVEVSASSPIIDTQPEDGSRYKILKDSAERNVKLVFPEDCALSGKELLVTVKNLMELTASIVEAFEALSAPTG